MFKIWEQICPQFMEASWIFGHNENCVHPRCEIFRSQHKSTYGVEKLTVLQSRFQAHLWVLMMHTGLWAGSDNDLKSCLAHSLTAGFCISGNRCRACHSKLCKCYWEIILPASSIALVIGTLLQIKSFIHFNFNYGFHNFLLYSI